MREDGSELPEQTSGSAKRGSSQGAGGAALCLLLLVSLPCRASDLAASGGWSRTVNSADLAAGAGSDLVGSYESAAAASTVDVTNTTGLGWRVDVRRSDATWDGRFTLSLRRTSDGAGGGSVSGGGGYQEVGPSDATLFTGVGDRSGVNLQYRLSGMSVAVPPGSYSTTVVLTVAAP